MHKFTNSAQIYSIKIFNEQWFFIFVSILDLQFTILFPMRFTMNRPFPEIFCISINGSTNWHNSRWWLHKITLIIKANHKHKID